MSKPSPAAPASVPTAKPYCPVELIKPYLVPYYLTVAAVLGAITVGFVVVFVLLGIVTANFNVLGWVE
jgi:hypothetical protein